MKPEKHGILHWFLVATAKWGESPESVGRRGWTGPKRWDLGECCTASALHINLQVAAFKDVDVCLHAQSLELVHVSGVHCHACASSTSGCAFVYFAVPDGIERNSVVSLFQAQDIQKQV